MTTPRPTTGFKTGEATAVTYAEAVRRVRARMRPGERYMASDMARIIWPHNTYTSQGAARVAGRFLRWMERDKVIRWRCDDPGRFNRGYVRCL